MSEQNDINIQQKRLDAIDQQEDREVLVGGKKYGEVIFGKVESLRRRIDTDAGITDARVKALPAFQKLKQDALKKSWDALRDIDEKNIDAATKKLEETLRQLEIKFEKMKELTPLLNTFEKFQKMFGALPFLRDWMTLYTAIDTDKRTPPDVMIGNMEKLMSIGGGYAPSGEMVKFMELDVVNLMGAYLRGDPGTCDATVGVLGERLAFARRVAEKLPQFKEERKKIEGSIREYESHNDELKRSIASGRPLDLLKGLEQSYLYALKLMPACKGMTKWGPDLMQGTSGYCPVNYELLLPEEVRKELSFTTVAIDGQGKPKDMPAHIPLTDEAMKKTEDILQGQLIMMRRGIYLTTKDPAYKAYFEASQSKMTSRLIDDALQYIAESGEENADIKKCIGIIAGNFDSVQRMQPENPVRAAEENSLFQKRILALKKKLESGGVDAHANTAGVLGNEMQFLGTELMTFVGLKVRSPKQHEAFTGILNTYLQQSRALSAQMLTQNPIVGEFQQKSVDAKQMFSGLATTFGNISAKIEKSGEGFSEIDMADIKREIGAFRSGAQYKFLKSSKAMSILQEMKKHMSDASVIPPRELAAIRQAEQSILQSQMALQRIDQTCEQLMAMDGYRTGAKGFAIDAMKVVIKIAAAVAGAVVVGGAITASGGLGLVAAGTGFGEVMLSTLATNALIAGGATVGGAMADSVMEQNMGAWDRDQLLKSWVTSAGMSVAALPLGTLLGKGMGTLSSKSMQAMQGSRFAGVRSLGAAMEARALKQAAATQAQRHTSGNIFRNMLEETKEELLEEGLENIGRAIAPDDPSLGFALSLLGTAYGHGKGVEGKEVINQKMQGGGKNNNNASPDSAQQNPSESADEKRHIEALQSWQEWKIGFEKKTSLLALHKAFWKSHEMSTLASPSEYIKKTMTMLCEIFSGLRHLKNHVINWPFSHLSEIDSVQTILPFFHEHNKKNVKLYENPAIDHSDGHVIEATIDGYEDRVAAKVYGNFRGLNQFVNVIGVGVELSLANTVGVGPKFLGYHVTERGELVILMEKVKGVSLRKNFLDQNHQSVSPVTEKTIWQFREQMMSLHTLGYSASFSSGLDQIMIDENGNITFINICLDSMEHGKRGEERVLSKLEEMRKKTLQSQAENVIANFAKQIREKFEQLVKSDDVIPPSHTDEFAKLAEDVRQFRTLIVSDDPNIDDTVAHIAAMRIDIKQKRMMLETAIHMHECRVKTKAFLLRLGEQNSEETRQKLTEYISSKHKISPFKGEIEYVILDGVLVVKCLNDDDLQSLGGYHEKVRGLAFHKTIFGIPIIFISPECKLDLDDPTVQHELQHVIKAGSNDIEVENLENTADRNRYIGSENETYIDANGDTIRHAIRMSAEHLVDRHRVNFKDEVLAYLLTNSRTIDDAGYSLLREGGIYDFIEINDKLQTLEVQLGDRVKYDREKKLIKKNILDKKEREEKSQLTPKELDQIREICTEVRQKHRAELVDMWTEVRMTVHHLMVYGMSENDVREYLARSLMFISTSNWKNHLTLLRAAHSMKPRITELDVDRHFGDQSFVREIVPIANSNLLDIARRNELLANNDMAILKATEIYDAIIRGNAERIIDSDGHSITIFRGKFIAAGGMGSVSHVAFVKDGEKKLTFGAIKQSHQDKKQYFDKEIEAARMIQGWNHPNIINPLIIQDDFIIFESSIGAQDLFSMKSPEIAKYFGLLLGAGQGIQELQDRGLIHGDIKELNVLNVRGIAKIIDLQPKRFKDFSSDNWIRTQAYNFTSEQLHIAMSVLLDDNMSIDEIYAHIGRSIDVRAFAEMVREGLSDHFSGWKSTRKDIAQFMDEYLDPIKAGKKGMLEKSMRFVKLVSSEQRLPTSDELDNILQQNIQ